MFGVSTYIFSHSHLSINASKIFSHNANLFRGDVIDIHENAFGEVVAAKLDISPNFIFSSLWVSFNWHLNYIIISVVII